MSKIFVGLLLVFLDINFTFNTTTIGLLPDFIGYFILIGGLRWRQYTVILAKQDRLQLLWRFIP